MNQPVPTFAPGQIESLIAAIAVHDDIDMEARLPARIDLTGDSVLLEHSYWISYRLWEQADIEALAALSLRIARTGQLDAESGRAFKDVRARAKQLRFIYAMLGEGHRYPFLLDHLTRIMGHAQDAMKARRRWAAALRGMIMRVMLNGILMSALRRELRSFVPASLASYRNHIQAQIARIHRTLAEPAATNARFHDTRKVISRLVALYDTFTILDPSDYHRAVTRYLSTINGLMGGMHDEMVLRKATSPRNYRRVAEPLPDAVAQRLATVVTTFTAAD